MADKKLILNIKFQNTEVDNQETLDSPSRRTTRQRTKPKKFGDFLEMTPTKRSTNRCEEESSDDENMDDDVRPQRPTALFTNDDVEGQDIFQFKSRHTKHDLQNKVQAAISNSPKVDSPKTPRRTVLSQAMRKEVDATPKHVKEIIKKRICKEVESESDSDFSGGSSSDYVPEGSDNESISSKSSHESSDKASAESEEETVAVQKSTKAEKVQVTRTKGNRVKQKDSDYIITPDNYFMMNSSKKIATSDHTLSRLKNLNLQDNELQNIEISQEHKKCILELNNSYRHLFDKWLYVLSEGFNIILYGIGSKRSIIHQFQKEKLNDFPCIVINGFFPSLTVKSILEAIVIDLLQNTNIPSNIGDVINLIDTQLSENDANLFLIVHNIDGTMLRNGKAQAMLAGLSQLKNVHTIASIDHINAPLLWDHAKLSKLRASWWDATSFLPYAPETAYEGSLLAARGGALQLASLRSVHRSLTANARGIFNLILDYQLHNQKQHYQGLPFKDLYSKCREQFLVSSDLALRAQLTEFLDHKLVKMKRTYDGSENLVIPIENTLLQQFLEQNKTS